MYLFARPINKSLMGLKNKNDVSTGYKNTLILFYLSSFIFQFSDIVYTWFFKEKKRQECLKEAKAPDYGWLMDWRLKSKKILDVRVIFAQLISFL